MKSPVLYNVEVAVPVTRRVRTVHANGAESFTSEPDGTKVGWVELYIDVETLVRQLGGRALRSKSGRSAMGHGLIKAKVVKGSVKVYPNRETPAE